MHNNTFIDGALGSNNLVAELLAEAASFRTAPGAFEDNVNCMIFVGAGVLSMRPFGDKPWEIGRSLVAIATETERTASAFVERNQTLEESGLFYRFNVAQGLQNIKLEDAKERPMIIAATDGYLEDLKVFKQILRCTDRLKAGLPSSRRGTLEQHQSQLPTTTISYLPSNSASSTFKAVSGEKEEEMKEKSTVLIRP
jgi:hypothetical protein